MQKITWCLCAIFSVLFLAVAINCDDDDSCDPAVKGSCNSIFAYCNLQTKVCTPCQKPLLDCNGNGGDLCEVTSTATSQENATCPTTPTGKQCGDASYNVSCQTTQCCDITTPTAPKCVSVGGACGTSQYCDKSSYNCVANKVCGADQACNPPRCCDTAAQPQQVCVASGGACSTANYTCSATSNTCAPSATTKKCGTNTCTNTTDCCDANNSCVPSGQACPTGGTCSGGSCSGTGNDCVVATQDSCKANTAYCAAGKCVTCTGTARNCDGKNDNLCECTNGCDPNSPSACNQGAGTQCPAYAPATTCTDSQVCVIFSDSGGENYECKNVPSECALSHTCLCLQGTAAYPCYGWAICDDTPTLTNTITCQE